MVSFAVRGRKVRRERGRAACVDDCDAKIICAMNKLHVASTGFLSPPQNKRVLRSELSSVSFRERRLNGVTIIGAISRVLWLVVVAGSPVYVSAICHLQAGLSGRALFTARAFRRMEIDASHDARGNQHHLFQTLRAFRRPQIGGLDALGNFQIQDILLKNITKPLRFRMDPKH